MKLTFDDLEAIAIGATVLGSGGGGDPGPELQRMQELFQRFGPPRIISLDALNDEELVVPLAFMGAPSVSIEKLASGRECTAILEMVENYFQKRVQAIVACEIGGSNAFVPLCEASCDQSLQVVDADMIGRAFPELQMSSCALHGVPCAPAFLVDPEGNRAIVFANEPKKVETMCRALSTSMGSNVAVSVYVMTGSTAKRALLANTLSYALEIGKKCIETKKMQKDVVELLQSHFQAKVIAEGVLCDIQQDIQDGFLRGSALISSDQDRVEVLFQNEYLFVRTSSRTLVTTPDIIVIMDKESGMPLAVEQLAFGLTVVVLQLAAPKIWKTDEGLSLVGPKAFGYEESL